MAELFGSEMELINALIKAMGKSETPKMLPATRETGSIWSPQHLEQKMFQDALARGEALDAPIPGANPEVPTPRNALVGALMAMAPMGSLLGRTAGGGNKELEAPGGRVYHGTFTKKPLRNRPGIHVGTIEQATHRITNPFTGKVGKGSHIFPMEFTPKKTARIADLGSGNMFPVNLARALKKAGYLSEPEFAKAKDHMSSIYRILRKKGYDAIEYKNKFEGPGKSYQILDISKIGPGFGKTEDPNVGQRTKIPKTRRKEMAKARAIRDLHEKQDILWGEISKAYDSGGRPNRELQAQYDQIRAEINRLNAGGK